MYTHTHAGIQHPCENMPADLTLAPLPFHEAWPPQCSVAVQALTGCQQCWRHVQSQSPGWNNSKTGWVEIQDPRSTWLQKPFYGKDS